MLRIHNLLFICCIAEANITRAGLYTREQYRLRRIVFRGMIKTINWLLVFNKSTLFFILKCIIRAVAGGIYILYSCNSFDYKIPSSLSHIRNSNITTWQQQLA